MKFNYQGKEGYDVSFWQDNNETPQQIDFNKMKSCGASFVIIRAGQNTWKDPDLEYNWRNAGIAGIPRGAYWFCDKRTTGRAQAQLFYDILKSVGWNGEPIAADYETGSWTDWNELYNFLVEIQKLTGLPDHKIFIYTGRPYWIAYSPSNLNSLNWFKRFPLWLAWYTSDPSYVQVPAPWDEAVLWQDGTPAVGKLCGAESEEIDHNKLNGGQDVLDYHFGEGIIVPPDTGEQPTMLYKGTVLVDLNVRRAPSYSGQWVKTMTRGSLVEADRVENGWWHLTSINGVPVPAGEEYWSYEGSSQGYIRTDEIIEIPPTTGTEITVDMQITLDADTQAVKTLFVNGAEYIAK